MIYFLTVIVAFCSLTYEFVIAQTLAAVFGGTLLQYAITIGVFTLAMGLGSLLSAKLREPSWESLFRVELALSVAGGLAAWWILAIDPVRQTWMSPMIAKSLALLPGFLVGLLTGLELPLLMRLARDPRIATRVLALDYGGMFLASVIFPLVLLPLAGVWGTSILIAGLNGVAGSVMLYKSRPKIIWWWAQFGVVAALTMAWLQLEVLEAFAGRWFSGI